MLERNKYNNQETIFFFSLTENQIPDLSIVDKLRLVEDLLVLAKTISETFKDNELAEDCLAVLEKVSIQMTNLEESESA